MASSVSRIRHSIASSSKHQSFSTSAISQHRSLPRPRAVRPISQKDTPTPKNVADLVKAYPQHPLLAFFKMRSRKIRLSPDSEEEKEVIVPVTLSSGDLTKDQNSRGWLAPELRTKSSLELHQLWYNCLKERNIIRTTMDEIQRTGSSTLAQMNGYNGYTIERRIKKTMARTKFVLNERRLALLEARRIVSSRTNAGEAEADVLEEDVPGPLYEEVKNI